MYALRRTPGSAEAFPRTSWSCALSRRAEPWCPASTPCPARAHEVPLYILGSSLFGAQLAAALGLPYAFASHFAPAALDAAIAAYRSEFQPSDAARAAVRDRRGQRHRRRHHQAAERQLQDIRRARAVSLYARQIGVRDLEMTDEQADQLLAAGAAAHVDEMLTYTALGTPRQVQDYLDGFLRHTGADELMVTHQAPSIEDRLRSIVLLGEAMLDLSTT